MSYTALMIIVPAICYGAAAWMYGQQGNWPLAVVYFGYLVANGGLLALDLAQVK